MAQQLNLNWLRAHGRAIDIQILRPKTQPIIVMAAGVLGPDAEAVRFNACEALQLAANIFF